MIKDPYYEHRRELKQKHEQKHEEQFREMEHHPRNKHFTKSWKQEELPFDWSAPLDEAGVEELFWGKLVQLNWKIQEYGENPPLSINIVLACPTCNSILDSYPKTSITTRYGNKMADSRYCEQIIASHSNNCQATPES